MWQVRGLRPSYLDCAVDHGIEPVHVNLGWLALGLWGQGHCIAGCIPAGVGHHGVPVKCWLVLLLYWLLRQGRAKGLGLDRYCYWSLLLLVRWLACAGAQDGCTLQLPPALRPGREAGSGACWRPAAHNPMRGERTGLWQSHAIAARRGSEGGKGTVTDAGRAAGWGRSARMRVHKMLMPRLASEVPQGPRRTLC